MNSKLAILVAVAVLLLPALSCGSSDTERPEPTQQVVQATDTPAQVPATATLAPAAAEATPAPTPTPQPLPTAMQPAAGSLESQWAIAAIASSEYDSPDWSAQQATGAPNTLECGDFETAWASNGASEQAWLEVSFAQPMVPTEIQIYETKAPGSIVQVEVIDLAGMAYRVWQGSPEILEICPRVFRVPVTGISSPVARVRISLDQSIVQDWDEIDAVQLIGVRQTGAAVVTAPPPTVVVAGSIIAQWASGAAASSEYDNPGWAAQQATGAPDTLECGDFETAWASQGASDTAWLEVSFATPVQPTEIHIYETNAPGSIVKVEVTDTAGLIHTVWEGMPQLLDTCPRVFWVAVTGVSSPVARVRITLDQSIVQDWNEIDAVQLVGVPLQ